MKQYIILGALLLGAILSSCSTTSQTQQSTAPVYQPVYGTSNITIHTIPEGAMVLVNTCDSLDYFPPFKYLASGYSPLTVPVQLADGLTTKALILQCTPTGPNQLSQRGGIPSNSRPGDYDFSMYNTGPGANL